MKLFKLFKINNELINTKETDKNELGKLFFKKLFEPLIEIQNRSLRFCIFLFNKQILNISKLRLESIKRTFVYSFILFKLKILSKFRKIRVGFLVSEEAKWTNQNLYNEFKCDKHFEPFILLTYFSRPQGEYSPEEFYKKTRDFFKQQGIKIYNTYDVIKKAHKNLNKYRADIIFYQQPWMIANIQKPNTVFNKSLLCYVPYCFYSMNSYINYLAKFHGIMWKYFVETDLHKTEYKTLYGANNCCVSGSTKLDNFQYLDKEKSESHWKTKDKKRIIYAPHHSFVDNFHEVATFLENGNFILNLAKSHPETEWIIRPHPLFVDRIIRNSIMTEDEINEYFEEWKKIGRISKSENYYEMFLSSDLLITDCISFLTEYALTLKPVIHLRKNKQKDEFNSIVKKLDTGYYQVYSNEELEKIFNSLIKDNNDFLKEKREKNIDILNTSTPASKKIYEYIKKELKIK